MSMRNIYRQIAKNHGVSVAEVKRDMQSAIDNAYANPPTDGVTANFQRQIPRKGEVPTADEVIKFAAKKIGDTK